MFGVLFTDMLPVQRLMFLFIFFKNVSVFPRTRLFHSKKYKNCLVKFSRVNSVCVGAFVQCSMPLLKTCFVSD